jgi:tetratricopeptide (TPR) repeat protein
MARLERLRHGLLAAVLLAKPVRADTWLEVKSPHFTLVSDAGEAEARRAAGELERFRSLVEKLSGIRVDRERPTTVLAVRNEAGLRDLLPDFWEAKGRQAPAGVFVRGVDRNYIVLRTDRGWENTRHTLDHEYVHLLTEANFSLVPLWLWEGLAEFYGRTLIDGNQVRWGGLSASARQVLQKRTWVPMDAFLTADRTSPYYTEARWSRSYYAQAAALTHYLLLGPPEARRRFQDLCRQLEEGVPDEGGTSALGDPEALRKALDAYVRGNAFSSRASAEPIEEPGGLALRDLPPAEALAARGELLVSTDRHVEGRALLEKALADDDRVTRAWTALGVALIHEARRDEATQALDRALQIGPETALAHYWYALALPRFGDASWAAQKERHLRRALELDPDFNAAVRSLANFYHKQGERLEEAINLARRACDLAPHDWAARIVLAGALRKASQLGPADEVEGKLRRRAAADPAYLDSLARYLNGSGRSQDAETMLRGALARRPRDLTTLRALAGFLYRAKRQEEAESVCREGLSTHPDSTDLLDMLAHLNADRRVHLDEALSLIDRALKKEPKDGSLLETRGWILFKLGRRAEAEAVLRQAAPRSGDVETLDHLADVVRESGKPDEALALWHRAMAGVEADDPRRPELEAKIRGAEESVAPNR